MFDLCVGGLPAWGRPAPGAGGTAVGRKLSEGASRPGQTGVVGRIGFGGHVGRPCCGETCRRRQRARLVCLQPRCGSLRHSFRRRPHGGHPRLFHRRGFCRRGHAVQPSCLVGELYDFGRSFPSRARYGFCNHTVCSGGLSGERRPAARRHQLQPRCTLQ